MWFSKETFHEMVAAGWVVDGRGGGFVLGRSHAAGNIYMVQETSDGRYFIPGHLEGGEYILSFDAYSGAKERLNQINSFKDEQPIVASVPITPKTRLLNTHSEPSDKMLWIDPRGQFIVNKKATARHFLEIEEINHEYSGFVCCDLGSLVPKEIPGD